MSIIVNKRGATQDDCSHSGQPPPANGRQRRFASIVAYCGSGLSDGPLFFEEALSEMIEVGAHGGKNLLWLEEPLRQSRVVEQGRNREDRVITGVSLEIPFKAKLTIVFVHWAF